MFIKNRINIGPIALKLENTFRTKMNVLNKNITQAFVRLWESKSS